MLVALGSGALKANASSLLGTLYDKGDARADGGFTLFYLGINLGAFVGPLITGLLQTHVGFHYGFGAAAVGMALGLGAVRGVPPQSRRATAAMCRTRCRATRSACTSASLVVVVAVVAAAFATGLVTLANLSQVTTGVIIVASIAYFAVMLTQPEGRTGRANARVRAFIPLFIANAVFWSLFQQIFTVLAVYSDERMNWSIFGWTAPSSWIGSIEPVWIILLSPRVRGHVDQARQPGADHAAQVRLRRDRHGRGVPAVPALGGDDGQGGARAAGRRHPGGVRGLGADALADRAVGHHQAGARRRSARR